jgi:hypothetical protein
MMEHFWAVWKAGTPALNDGSVILAQYDNLETEDAPSPTGMYAEVFIEHTSAPQQTFGATGGRRFRSFGQFIVVVHIPTGSGRLKSDQICQVLVDGFRGQQTGPDRITFRDPIIQEVGRKGTSWDQNFICAFDYDEIA